MELKDTATFLNHLNNSQRDAVEYVDGPSLVIAGAGSGKTMVLTYKIAYLLQCGYKPYSILALTFTNKAAREMKSRIGKLVGDFESSSLWMGTFHSIFNRILRREAHLFGFTPNYTIYDSNDSKSLVKSILKEMELDDKTYKPALVLSRISEAKNALVTPREYAESRETLLRDQNYNIPRLVDIYKMYCLRCHQANSMDFDDLLLYTYLLFENYPDVCNHYSESFKYILVDEYQDTNFAQHKILMQLAHVHQHICVVGDDAQSIYSFRGANIDNILHFQDLYKGSRLFKLEQNYRSTQNIVGAANSLIAKNKHQIPKTIYSDNSEGMLLSLKFAFSDVEEGEIVANQIAFFVRNKKLTYEQIAILYRTNAQSRIFEEALRKHAIPYRIYGSRSFYDQKIIKDVLAYFRLIVNPNDEEAFKRIINFPARGLGDVTVRKILNAANSHQISIWQVMADPLAFDVDVNANTLSRLHNFYELINGFRASDNEDASVLGEKVVWASGIMQEANKDTSVDGKELQANLSELLNSLNTFVSMQRETGSLNNVYMTDYLNEVALLSDTDDSKTEGENRVTLMTVHSSKGLEFDTVFIVGMEEELFPNQMAMYSLKEMEEERRLFYVAITRAKNRCYLSCSKSRYHFGQMEFYKPSRFLGEIDSRFIDSSMSKQTSSPESIFSTRKSHNISSIKPKTTVNGFVSKPIRRVTETQTSATLNSVVISGHLCGTGTKVEHARFGRGEIRELLGTPDNPMAVIVFENLGEKKLLLKYAKLEIIK